MFFAKRGGFTLKNQASVVQLNSILTENFNLHGNNSITLADFMISMWLARTVNLSQMANYSTRSGKIAKEHIYRGYQYLVHNFSVSQKTLATGILKMFGLLLPSCQLLLAVDRTNWRYGDKDINLLVLSVVINGCGVPLFWIELDSRGNSDTEERKQLMDEFILAFGADKIRYVLADREFIGNDWFEYLANNNVKFIIRIKGNMLVEYNGNSIHSATLCKMASITNILTFDGNIDNRQLRIQATRSTEKALVIVVSNDLETLSLLELYLKRWAIECLFANFKSKGFNFEDTHFTMQNRIGNLTKLLALACAITLLLGIVRAINNPIIIKKHGYKQNSYFRYGLDFMINQLIHHHDAAMELILACLMDYQNWNQVVIGLQRHMHQKTLGHKR